MSASKSREVCVYQKLLPVAENLPDQNSKGPGRRERTENGCRHGQILCENTLNMLAALLCFVFIFCIFIKGQRYFKQFPISDLMPIIF